MAQDRFGRRLIHRGGSPPSSFASEDMMRAVRLPQRNCFTDTQMNRQRPLRTKTAPMHNTVAGGPRLPRNRIGSLFNTTAGDVSRAPVRTQSATTLYVNKPVSPPVEHRVPPVATISRFSNDARHNQQFDSGLGLGLEKPKPTRKPSIPGYRARCIDDAESDDDIQTDYVHESIKPLNTEITSFVTPRQQVPSLKPQPRNLSFKPTPSMLQKQDSGVEDQQMDTLQSPTSPLDEANGSSFDPQTYQRHLEDIQRSAMEWSRLQEGLAMLLPNVDGDT